MDSKLDAAINRAAAELYSTTKSMEVIVAILTRHLSGFVLVPPPLPPCPACGGPVETMSSYGGFVHCSSSDCKVQGPSNDPTGEKWRKMCAKVAT